MKKKLIIIALALILVSGLTFFFVKKSRSKNSQQEETVKKKKVSRPVNIIPVAERPYMTLLPSADGHYITIGVEEVKKEADELNYEMEYQTGSMLQGFQGLFSLTDLPTSEKKLFGSRSAGGSVTYHEDIKGGNLMAQFEGGEGYAVKSAWRYFTNSESETEFKSQDTKFTVSNDSLKNFSYVVIYNSPGYPEDLDMELASDPYVLRAEKSLKTLSTNFEVSIRTSEENVIIMGFDGSKWLELETMVADGIASSKSPFMDVYLLAKK